MHTFSSAISLLSQQSLVRRFWFPEPDSTFAPRQDDLFMFIFWVSVFFFVLLMGLMFLFVWKYRRTPQRLAPEPTPSHHTPLEITWTVAPVFLLVIMFVWGFKEFMYMNIAPGDSEEIQVSASQWNWDFTYANGARTDEFVEVADKDVPIFAVPANRPIKLVMSSQDVLHSFWVPGFRVNMDIMPNRYTTLWFEATGEPQPHYNDQGEHIGDWKDHYLFCAEYCGEGHGQMGAIIRVMPASQYEQWTPPTERRARVRRGKACMARLRPCRTEQPSRWTRTTCASRSFSPQPKSCRAIHRRCPSRR